MQLGGLDNLFRDHQAPAAKGNTTVKDESKSSFEKAMGQQQQQSPPKAEGNGLPSAPTAPTWGGPVVTERIYSAPAEMPVAKPTLSFAGKDLEAEESVDNLTRRVVWADFLRKMKEEFDVSAEDVLDAFASLSPEELALPPQQNVDKVVMALGLEPQSAQLAKQYFSDLIAKTKPKSLGEELEVSGRQINLTLMTQRELQRKQLDRRLEAMNSNFFIQRPQAAVPSTAIAAATIPAPTATGTEQTMATPGKPELNPLLQQMEPVKEVPFEQPVPHLSPRNEAPIAVNSPSADGNAAPPTYKESPVDQILRQFVVPRPVAVKTDHVSELPQMVTSPVAPPIKTETPIVNMTSAAPMLGFARPEFGDSTAGEDEDFTSDASYLGATLAGESGVQGATQAGEFRNELQQAAPVQSQPGGVQDIVSQAQVMIRDGGGEMKVKLNQDGLGEVAMKVNVEHGKVSVQMITESDEAKRLIERELADLKTQLQANHLQVDTIKVDTATGLGKQLDQQYQDAQRHMAQQTLEQFRQDHQGWRRSFFEVPGVKQYKGQAEAPRDGQAPMASNRRAGSRRLDLVA